MKILLIGPSETKARGGMSEVIRGIRESELLGNEFEIDSFPSYIDGSLPVRLLYCFYAYFRFMVCYRKYDLFHIHTAERGSTFRKNFYLKKIKIILRDDFNETAGQGPTGGLQQNADGNGKTLMSYQTLCCLADYFGTSVDYLLGRTDETAPYPPSRRK